MDADYVSLELPKSRAEDMLKRWARPIRKRGVQPHTRQPGGLLSRAVAHGRPRVRRQLRTARVQHWRLASRSAQADAAGSPPRMRLQCRTTDGSTGIFDSNQQRVRGCAT